MKMLRQNRLPMEKQSSNQVRLSLIAQTRIGLLNNIANLFDVSEMEDLAVENGESDSGGIAGRSAEQIS